MEKISGIAPVGGEIWALTSPPLNPALLRSGSGSKSRMSGNERSS